MCRNRLWIAITVQHSNKLSSIACDSESIQKIKKVYKMIWILERVWIWIVLLISTNPFFDEAFIF